MTGDPIESHPEPVLPRAYGAISKAVRLLCLRDVAQHPGTTRQELCARTGLTTFVAYEAITDLEALAYVTANVPITEPRRGRTLTYTVDRGRLARDVGDLIAWFLDPDLPQQQGDTETREH